MRHIKKQKTRIWQKNSRTFAPSRFKKKSKNSNGKIAITILLLLLSMGIFYIMAFSNFFKIKNIEISGAKKIDQETVRNFLAEEIKKENKYYIPGENYFILDQKKIDQRILEEFPQVKSIKTHKGFPSSLAVQIEEKESALIWCREKCFFVNPQGFVFMEANEEELVKEKQSFIKIVEEEGTEDETDKQSSVAENEKETKKTTVDGTVMGEQKEAMQSLVEVEINDRVSDDNFIKSAIDINEKMSYNSKLKVKFYKTGGTKTRELIAFTDKNTRIYFDTTKDLDTQIKNLNYFLNNELEQGQIDTLQYIYLKNQDRIFYK
jgi:hypothetical protein